MTMANESDLGFFTLLARQGSLTATARELGVTPGAVSKRLQHLERRLGVRLVQRTTRSMSLTQEGETYLGHAQRILADIDAAEASIATAHHQPRGLLRVNATFGFGRAHLVPAMTAFARQYPDVQLQLQLTDEPLDLADQAFDLGIRVAPLADTILVARRIAPNRKLLLASPGYLAAHGTPDKPADLALHQCLVIRENHDAYALWRLGSGRLARTVRVQGALSSNDGEAVRQWALAGLGIIMRSEWDVAADVKAGRLVEVLPAWKPAPADIFAVYPERERVPAKVKTFVDFLCTTLGDVPPWRR
jgi:DNA-binding transcriptional LysR family regulator